MVTAFHRYRVVRVYHSSDRHSLQGSIDPCVEGSMDGNRSKGSRSVSTDHERRPTIFLRRPPLTYIYNPGNIPNFTTCNPARYKRPPLEDCHCYWRVFESTMCVIYRFRSFMHRGLNREFLLEILFIPSIVSFAVLCTFYISFLCMI